MIALFWKRAGLVSYWFEARGLEIGIHLLPKPSCWQWGPTGKDSFEMANGLGYFGFGPLLNITWSWL